MNLSISPADDGLIPAYFVRHHRQLRALLIEQQVWFVVRDLSKLLNRPVEVQLIARLDHDQSRYEQLAGHPEPQLLVSESGLYALLLVYCYHPENRSLRQWLSNEVVPPCAIRRTTTPACHVAACSSYWAKRCRSWTGRAVSGCAGATQSACWRTTSAPEPFP